MKTEQRNELNQFVYSYSHFIPEAFLDWALWKAQIQFQIECIGGNGGWKIKRVDPACIENRFRIEHWAGYFKELVWQAAQTLSRIYPVEPQPLETAPDQWEERRAALLQAWERYCAEPGRSGPWQELVDAIDELRSL